VSSEIENGAGPRLWARSKPLRDWIVVVVIALGAAMFVRVWILQQYYISGPSMEPTLQQNNRVLVNKLSYRFGEPERGDIIVFDRQTRSENGGKVLHDDLIKRVIGLPGETIEIKNCELLVDGSVLSEPYLGGDGSDGVACSGGDFAATKVPPGEYFVLGDNRPQSSDSRAFGTVAERDIVGRAFVLVWPLGKVRML